MINTVIVLNHHDENPGSWVVYTLYDAQGKPQFMGCCKLGEINYIPDAKSHNMFLDTFGNAPSVTMVINGVFHKKEQGIAFRNRFIMSKDTVTPRMNQFYASYNRQVGVECLETGEYFKTLNACAKAHDISQGNLSRHLKGHEGYKSLKGRTYKRSERKNVR